MTQILLADDNPDLRSALRLLLETRLDTKLITEARDMEHVLAQAEDTRPDCIVLDYKLPDIDGNRVCKTIRANPAFGGMKIILISGVADPDEINELLSSGAHDFLLKPFQIDELISRILKLVQV